VESVTVPWSFIHSDVVVVEYYSTVFYVPLYLPFSGIVVCSVYTGGGEVPHLLLPLIILFYSVCSCSVVITTIHIRAFYYEVLFLSLPVYDDGRSVTFDVYIVGATVSC